MSGRDKILFDTNAIISILNGNSKSDYSEYAEVFISVISELEFLSFTDLSQSEINAFNILKSKVSVVYVEADKKLINSIITIRQEYKLKLPDSIIAASAILNDAKLLTNDKDFKKIKALKTISY